MIKKVTEEDPIIAWHFGTQHPLPTIAHGVDQYTLGLHGCVRAVHAALYSPGPILRRVAIWGDVLELPTKVSGTRRKTLWTADASKCLEMWAIEVAMRVLSGDRMYDGIAEGALLTKLRFLQGHCIKNDLERAWRDVWYHATQYPQRPELHMAQAAVQIDVPQRCLRKTVKYGVIAETGESAHGSAAGVIVFRV